MLNPFWAAWVVHRATSIVHTSVQRTKPSIPCYCTSFFRRYGSSTTTSADASPQASLSPSLLQQLEGLTVRHATITKELEDPHISVASLTSLSKEAAELSPVVEALRVFKDVRAAMASANAVCDDPHEDADVKSLAREEISELRHHLATLEGQLLRALLPRDASDTRDVVLEVRAGTGGDEACLFASDLFTMYRRYAAANGWRFEEVEIAEGDAGGYRFASAAIAGDRVYGRLKYESGVHRVQRVPATESSGRLHTSAASVAVLPQAEEVDVTIRDDELKIDTYRSSGAGGQHVNTTNSAVRITHLPSGLVVAIQDERSQHKNKAKALKVLRARLYERQQQQAHSQRAQQRKGLIGSGDRSERVRTYNFPQGRVTDHRVHVTVHGIDSVMAGEKLDEIVDALAVAQQTEQLALLAEAQQQ